MTEAALSAPAVLLMPKLVVANNVPDDTIGVTFGGREMGDAYPPLFGVGVTVHSEHCKSAAGRVVSSAITGITLFRRNA